jgi:hypothetical protein
MQTRTIELARVRWKSFISRASEDVNPTPGQQKVSHPTPGQQKVSHPTPGQQKVSHPTPGQQKVSPNSRVFVKRNHGLYEMAVDW